MNIGNKIKTLRLEKNLSVKSFSDKCNISSSYLYQIERGDKKYPSIETLKDIASALDVTIENLISDPNLTLNNRKIPIPDAMLNSYSDELPIIRKQNLLGLIKVAELLKIEPELLKEIEDKKIKNADILSSYEAILKELLELKNSLNEDLVNILFFNDNSDINLADLLGLSRSQHRFFINNVQRYVKFALEEAKNSPTSKDSINPITGGLFKK